MRLKSIKAICLISVLCLLASGCSSKSTNINTKETNSITAEKNKRRNKDAKPGVEFSAPSGIYDAEFDVTISATDGGTIFYTLDGSDPACSKSAMPYTGNIKITDRTGAANIVSAVDPVLISGNFNKVNSTKDGFTCDKVAPQDSAVDKCTVIRANVKYEDDTWGIEGSETYFVGSMQDHIPGYKESLSDFNEKLAVISLSVNYDDLFDYETGIYVKGKTFDEDLENYLKNDQLWDGETARGLEANYKMRGKEWERECNMTMMELSSDGSLSSVLNQNCGIRIQGNYSRSDLQKGFRLYAREEYGDNTILFSLSSFAFKYGVENALYL